MPEDRTNSEFVQTPTEEAIVWDLSLGVFARATVPQTALGGASVRPDLRPIPGYEVIAVIGRGGMGVVYKARQQTLTSC
jgi:serine/threonine protein kinase